MRTGRVPPPESGAVAVSGGDDNALDRCLSLDLEVSPSNNRINQLAGVRLDTGQSVAVPRAGRNLSRALVRLDELADGAEFVLGHNLIAFDLRHLQAANRQLRLLRLPAVDTLRLNPLAFPRNPYHHLVKHYQDGQLKRERINNPELDARLALDLFADQQKAFRNAPPELLTAWHWLTTCDGSAGFDLVFSSLRGAARPSDAEAHEAMYHRLDGAACRTHARNVVANAPRQGWGLAYALAWLSVAGGNSVLPPWVRHQFPETGRLVRQLRDDACVAANCDWCRERHDAQKELKRWFVDFDDFRPEPADESGRPLQRSVVAASLAGEHTLAIMPTGAGKSLCYQLPALSRYDKTGALTVVISPLVALMKDQVEGLEKRGIDSCVTVNGLLSMPERADALDRVRLGDAGILIISPEQLRSVSMRKALAQREIGGWVLDEAHCLSKWGHDFRPDYRYVGRFVKERAGNDPIPPLLCLTATAKPDVRQEIVDYFKDELDIDLAVFDGGSERANLEFVVVPTGGGAKFSDIHQILTDQLPADGPSGAIIYCATRKHCEEVAGFLQEKGVAAGYFHARLMPETKKRVQDDFIEGRIRAIAATNAFGMGIDKPDVRLVIHADIPGSLENYLQEAGRAGRDQRNARCVLLYGDDDVERQFGMSARSRLTRREIHGVLRALRNLDRKKRLNGELEATAGEILREDDEAAFERDSATDDTRVRTAVSWLEEAALLTREENRVNVFPSSLRVNSIDEARAGLQRANLAATERDKLLAICAALFEADADEGITTDELMSASGMTSEMVRNALHKLKDYGIASNDVAITAFVHRGVAHSSRQRYDEAADLEEALIAHMRIAAPDQEVGEVSVLHLRRTAQALKNAGHAQALPEKLRRIVRSIGADGRGEGGGGGSFGLRGIDAESIRVTLQRDWRSLEKTAVLRRRAARLLMEHLTSQLPAGSRGTDLLAETTMEDLRQAVTADPLLKSQVTDHGKLMELALMWLHDQEVIRLNKGLTVFRQAMTIRLRPERRGFANSDFESLKIHYDQQIKQIHVMMEYAQRGLQSMADALSLAMDYFSLGWEAFLRRWLPQSDHELLRQTTPESWRAIVDNLNNPVQRRIVADDREQTNVLVLAGPGSGKTRVLVHRIAYLVRVRRENPRGILALAYNRHAAVEIRRRLAELIGDDARGVTVLTCHALAMRLVGASFEGRGRAGASGDDDYFREVMRQATALLRGEGLPPEDADEYRERLLAGFRWILVDEYQDIGPDQYNLISALAGRTLAETDAKLSLFAVGDDDQNIYAFNGASTEFIRRFEADYEAKPAYLTENYRSTEHIIAAANAVIAPASARMKVNHPIVINRVREKNPPGGDWTLIDPVAQGRVRILPAGDNAITQAHAAVTELKRLADLAKPNWDWSKCAVIAREWRYLDPVRSLCEIEPIPVQLANEEFSGVWRLRETQALVAWLRARGSALVKCADVDEWLDAQDSSPWLELLREGVAEYRLETGGAETPVDSCIEWLAEWSRDVRRRQRGLLLLTAHRAKGLEFDHVVVLDGNWGRVGKDEDPDAPRRLYYVAMTRARQTLTLMRFPEPHPFLDTLSNVPAASFRKDPVALPQPRAELARQYRRFSLSDVFLSFAGYRPANDPVHHAIAALSTGDSLQARPGQNRWDLLDKNGVVVGQLAGSFKPPDGMRCTSATVFAIASWRRDLSEPNYQRNLRCDAWEVVVPELVFGR